MLWADAREVEVQAYLRRLEQQALPATIHPIEARLAIAAALWRAAALPLVTSGPPRGRDVQQRKARERTARRFGSPPATPGE